MPPRPSTANGGSGTITFSSPFGAPMPTETLPPTRLPVNTNETPLPSPTAISRLRAVDNGDRRRSIAVACYRPLRPDLGDARRSQDVLDRSECIQPSREALFADHLSAILNHSLTLCSASDNEQINPYLPAPPLDSPPLTPPSLSPRSPSSETAPPTAGPQVQRQRIQRLPSLPSISTHDRRRLIARLQLWSFNAHELDDDELWECAAIMFDCVLNMEGVKPGVDATRIRSLLISLRAAYHARNAYHNFTHATDVLQALYSFLVALGVAPPLSTLYSDEGVWHRNPAVDAEGGMGELLRPMDVFALLIAAIGHDVGHPGLSNAYMVNARTPVAEVYGGKSCLENFHSITLVHMLKKHGFGHLSEPNALGIESEFRKVLTASVLATDMSSHFPIVAKLQEAGRRFNNRQRTPELVEEDRLLMCSCLMKCADISNPSRPHDVARAWSTCLLEEWAEQARIEAEFKLPISVVMLNPAEKRAQAKSQVGFINLFTQPLFDSMATACPDFAVFAQHCREGRRTWEQVVLEITDSAPPSPPQPRLRPPPALQSFGASLNASPRRSAPPKPLILASGQRGSVDSSSTTSTSVSPFSPFFQRHANRYHGRNQSSSTMATDVEELDRDLLSPVPPGSADGKFAVANGECDGSCSNVTARCAACMQKEREARSTPSLATTEFHRDWPPYPFCPTVAAA